MAYLKNIADSLKNRVLPDVAKSLFPEEAKKITSFKEKLKEAKELYAESEEAVKGTFGDFKGVGGTISTITKQAKTGKFGTESDWEDKYLDHKMMGDDDSFNSSNDSSSLDELDNFDFGGDDNSTTNNINNNVQNNFSSDNSDGFNSIADKIVQSNQSVNTAVGVGSRISAEVGSRMLGLTSRISSDLATLANFHTTETAEFHRASLEFFQIQTEVNSMLSDGFPKITTNAEYAIKERELKETERMRALMGDETEGFASLLDPHRLLTKLTDDTMFGSMFDENMSPIAMMISKFSSDPLGVIVGSALGTGIGSMFGAQIDFIKHQAGAVEYRIQEMLESWGEETPDSPMGFLKNALGNLLKVDRETSGSISVGTYENKEISFDVQTKKAIVDVIPMYLAKILKAVSGADDFEVYDYEKAQFGGSQKMVADLKAEALNISEGNTFGLGRETDTLLASQENLDNDIKEKIRSGLQEMSRMSNSSNTSLSNIAFDDEDTTNEFRKMFGGLTQKEQYAFEDTFRKHKFESQRMKKAFEDKLKFSGKDQSIILNNDELSIAEEDSLSKIRSRTSVYGSDENPEEDDSVQGRIAAARARLRNRTTDGVVNPLNDWLNEGLAEDNDLGFKDKLIRKFENGVLIPFKQKLLGVDIDEAKESTLFEAINIFMNEKVLMPFKKRLVGEERAKELGFFRSIQTRIDESILVPFKQKLLGKDTTIETAKDTSLWQSISQRFDKSILIPFKQIMLGKEVDLETVKNTSVWKSISTKLNESVLIPFKHIMLGKDTDLETVKETGLWKSISYRIDKSILFPFKTAMLGKDTDLDTIKNTSVWQSISQRFDKSILFPFKKALLGGNENKASKFGLMKSINHRLDRSVFMPLKTLLIGNDERSTSEIAKTSLYKSLKIGFTEKIVEPLSGMLFGQDKRKMGFFSNLGATMSPFFNKVLFGYDKASKHGFLENLKTEGKALWSNMWSGAKDNFFRPAVNTFKEFFGPVLKEFSKTMGSEIKHFSTMILGNLSSNIKGSITDGIKTGAGNLFKNVFGDETVDLLRNNIILPLQDLTKTLTDNMSKIFKFLLRLPLNFLKGITDTMKINRMTAGRGDYSEEETARLTNLKNTGKTFNFLDLGDTKQQDSALSELNTTSSPRDQASIFSRVFSSDSKKSPEEVVDNITPNPAERVAKAKDSADKEAQGIKPPSANMGNLKFTPAEPKANLLETKANLAKAKAEATNAANSLKATASNNLLSSSIESNTKAAAVTTAASNSLISSNEILTATLSDTSNTTNSIFREVGNKLSLLLSNSTNLVTGETSSISGEGGKHRVSSEMANAATVHMNTKFNALLPITTSISSTASSMHKFMKDNLVGTSARVENIVRMMRKKNKGPLTDNGDGGKIRRSFLRNPLGWMADTVTGTLGAIGSIVTGSLSSVSKVASALLTIPGKIAGTVVNAGTALVNGILTVTTDVINGVSKALTGIITGLGSIVGSLAENLGKIASGLVSAVSGAIAGIGQVIGPLANAVGGLIAGITKGIVPVIGAVANGLSSLVNGIVAATEGLAKFTWGVIAAAGRGLAKLTTGSSDGFSKGTRGGIRTDRVHVTNFIDLLGLSRITPMHVIVRGGKVMIEQPKAKRILRSTSFLDNEENRLSNKKRNPLDFKNKDKDSEDDSILDGPLGDAASTGAGVLAANIITKATKGLGGLASAIFAALGVSKLGKMFKKLGTAAFIAATQLPLIGNSIGKLARRLRRTPLVGPPLPPGPPGRLAAAGAAIKGKAAALATGAGAAAGRFGGALKNLIPGRTPPLVGPPRPPLVGPPLPPVPPAALGVGGKLLKYGKGVAKGAGVASLISMGGNIAADTFFEEGTAGNAVTKGAADGAAMFALIGSIIPGVGTAVGAVIGAVLGTIVTAGPRLLKWFEEKYEKQIRAATDYFIEIPERITMFVETLPDRITGFVQAIPDRMGELLVGLPEKIVNIFTGDSSSATTAADGSIVEKTPSILGRLFGAIGSGIFSIIKALPKLIVTVLEGAIKAAVSVGITATVGLGNALTHGFASLSTLLAKTLERVFLRVRKEVGRLPFGESLGGLSDEDYDKAVNASNKKYDAKAKAISDRAAQVSAAGSSAVKTLTNWSAAQYVPTFGTAGVTRDKEAYYAAVKENPNSKKAAEAAYNKATNGKGTAFANQVREAEYRASTAGNYAGAGMVGGQNAKFMDGKGGNYANSPQSKGDGWQNNRDLIMYASNATGVDPILMAKIAAIESGFRPRVVAKGSSASGLYQFIDGTWAAVKAKHGRKFGIPANARQTDPVANALLGAAHIKDNAGPIQKLTGGVTAQDIYMAHFLGSGGANKFLKGMKADPQQAGTNLVTAAAAKANSSIFYKNGQRRTARAVYAELANRVNTAASQHGVNLEGMNSGTWQDSNGFANGNGSQGNLNGGAGGSGSATDTDALEAKLMHAEYFNKMADIQGLMTGSYKGAPVKMDMQQIINEATASSNSGGMGSDNGGGMGYNNEDEGSASGTNIAGAKSTPFVSNNYLAGLRVKGGINGQATGGGGTRQHTADFAKVIQGALGSELVHFSSFNDRFHKNRGGQHPQGNAIDFSISNPKNSRQVVKTLKAKAAEQGFQIKVLDEYVKPSKGATGGHIHVSVTGRGKGSIPMAAPVSAGNGGGGTSYSPEPTQATGRIAELQEQYVNKTVTTTAPKVAEKVTTASSTKKGNTSKKDSVVNTSNPTVANNLETINKLIANSINIEAGSVNLNGRNVSEFVSTSVQQSNGLSEIATSLDNSGIKQIATLIENTDGMDSLLKSNFMPTNSTGNFEMSNDKINSIFEELNTISGFTPSSVSVEDSIKDSTDISKTLNISTTRRLANEADKFKSIFEELNTISGFTPSAHFGEQTGNKENVQVSIDDINNKTDYTDRVISATTTSTAPLISATETSNDELKAHTALLREIADNTKKTASMKQSNFFTSDSTVEAKEKDRQEVVATTTDSETKLMVNQSFQNMKMDMDTFPGYIQPSKGALAVSTGGNRV